jgi:hypothetical protein
MDMQEGDTVIFGGQPFEVIDVYTRAQAIEDGVLVDVTDWAKEAHFKYPVAVTAAVYALLEPSEHSRKLGQSEKGRAMDMFNMMHFAIKAKQGPTDLVFFDVKFGNRVHRLKSLCHPGDLNEPVITIMLPEED